MSEAPHYPVGTIHQMADIPEEALPRFLAELPDMLGQIRSVRQMAAGFNEQFGEAFRMSFESAGDPVWVDDDLGIATVTVSMPGDGEIVVKRKIGDVE